MPRNERNGCLVTLTLMGRGSVKVAGRESGYEDAIMVCDEVLKVV